AVGQAAVGGHALGVVGQTGATAEGRTTRQGLNAPCDLRAVGVRGELDHQIIGAAANGRTHALAVAVPRVTGGVTVIIVAGGAGQRIATPLTKAVLDAGHLARGAAHTVAAVVHVGTAAPITVAVLHTGILA